MPIERFRPDNQIAYDKVPVQLKVMPGVRDRLKKIDGWQAMIREYIDKLIESDRATKGDE
jgi:hypothetical protein